MEASSVFEAIVKKTVKSLYRAQKEGLLKDFALIGAFAVARWGIPRATGDLDFIITIDESNRASFANALGAIYRKGSVRDPLAAVFELSVPAARGAVQVQLIQFPPSWEKAVFADIHIEKLDGIKIPIVGWQALVLLKLYAGGPTDLNDAVSVLKTTAPNKSDIEKLKTKAQGLRVSKKLEKLLTQI